MDSIRTLRIVRSEQSAFEAFRRNRLPRTGSGSGGGICDVRIGRYCYWRGDDDVVDPPPEPRPIAERRTALIRMLDTAAASLPGDAWIAGQRVRYLVEANRTTEALRAAAECAAEVWWCAALAGYAAHDSLRFATADSAFGVALAAMDEAQRCRWLDISENIEDDLAGRYKTLTCARRDSLAGRLFALGAPLYSVSLSDLLSEHLARATRAKIAERSAGVDGEAWADDQRSLMLRYGWPKWYTQSDPGYGSMSAASVMGHDPGMPYAFFPTLRGMEHVGHITNDDWPLDDKRAMTGYSPPYARTLHILPAQVAAFRRGDSTLVVAAWDARRDTTLSRHDFDAALVLVAGDTIAAVSRTANAAVRGRLSAAAVIDSGIASVELLAPKEHRAARARFGIVAPNARGLALSDLLLYAPGDASVNDLDAARDSVLASTQIERARAVGVYWETYGLPTPGGPAKFALSLERTEIGWMERAAERVHLAQSSTSLAIAWEEVPRSTNGIVAHGVKLDLSRLKGSRYRMTLRVTAADGSTATSLRDIELR